MCCIYALHICGIYVGIYVDIYDDIYVTYMYVPYGYGQVNLFEFVCNPPNFYPSTATSEYPSRRSEARYARYSNA